VLQSSGSITTTTLTVFADTAGDDGGAGGIVYLDSAAATSVAISGSGDRDTLRGTAGADNLDGQVGADTMAGRLGDDFYFVDHGGDVATELVGEGTDRVFASVTYTLNAGSHIETLSTTNNAGTGAINLTGNELTNTLIGNAGANTLDGGAGADSLYGFGGDDFFYVDNAGDAVFEGAGAGTDRIFASVTYVLGAGVQVETLSTTNNAGTDAINLTGNALVNSLTGNAGNNSLNGSGGADTLFGLGGDDFYFVDNAADAVFEGAGLGTDRVFASVSYTLAASMHVETMSTTDSAGVNAINLTGNELANSLIGNAGSNVLDGKGGNDTLNASGGTDTFRFTTALGAGNVDAIQGFVVADDTIEIDNAVFTGLAGGALAAGAFRIGAAAADADDRIIYNSVAGTLLFDADGNGAGAAVQFATISVGLAMTSADFIVI
jgi:serralysin